MYVMILCTLKEINMNVSDALNKIGLYSSILGYGEETASGSLLRCLGVSIYSNVKEFTDDIGKHLELSVNIVKEGKLACHYKSVYMFPRGCSSIFSGLKGDELKNFVDVMLGAVSCVSSCTVCDEKSFRLFEVIVSFSEKLGEVSDKAELCVK